VLKFLEKVDRKLTAATPCILQHAVHSWHPVKICIGNMHKKNYGDGMTTYRSLFYFENLQSTSREN